MEKIIGIFDEQTTYAERLKQYINEKKEIGCFAVTFRDEEELWEYCQRKKLLALVAGESMEEKLEQKSADLDGVKVWILSEEQPEKDREQSEDRLFRYQRAGELIRRILRSEAAREERLSELYTVFSPENGKLAEDYVWKLIGKLIEKGKILLLPWDPFLGYGREEKEGERIPSISELLYLVRKDKKQAGGLFLHLPKKRGAEYFGGPDFCTDLWQYSEDEMRSLIRFCREKGEYKYIIFLAGTFCEGVLAVMNQSNGICMVTTESGDGLRRKQEFYRQMKYAGEQEILSRLTEVVIPLHDGKTEDT